MTLTDWKPLSVRRGRREADGPHEGMPKHLRHPTEDWLKRRFGWYTSGGMDTALMARVASACRIPVRATTELGGIMSQILSQAETDEDLFLDVLDATLHLTRGSGGGALDDALRTGGSVWSATDDPPGLARRVPEATADAYAQAVAADDAVADELREAWGAVFGRHPNPSDGWDHAIKAVEDLLIPLVVPKATKPNLGSVTGELKANPDLWEFGLPGNNGRGNGEVLEGLLRHIWPNPDRHGGAAKRPPTQEEAEAAVQVAVLVVGLCRGRLTKVKR